jgi:hypothetical protein
MRSANIEYRNETLMLETYPKKQEGFTGTRKVPGKMMNILMIQNMDQGYIKVGSLTVHFPTTLRFYRHLYILPKNCFSLKNQIFIKSLLLFVKSRDSIVSITTGCGLDDQGIGVQVLMGAKMFASPCRPNWLWGPPNLLSNG